MSVPSVSIVSISVAISKPLSMLVPRMFWKPKRVKPSPCCLSVRGSPAAGMLVRTGWSSNEEVVSLVWSHLFRGISIVGWYGGRLCVVVIFVYC